MGKTFRRERRRFDDDYSDNSHRWLSNKPKSKKTYDDEERHENIGKANRRKVNKHQMFDVDEE